MKKNQTKYKGTPITDSLIEANRKFIVEAEQLIYLLKKYNRKEDKNNMLMFIENISFILENIAMQTSQRVQTQIHKKQTF